MAQQTAVMQLIKFILVERRQENGSIQFHIHEDFGKFLQIEKEQIMSVIRFVRYNNKPSKSVQELCEQYYKETF